MLLGFVIISAGRHGGGDPGVVSLPVELSLLAVWIGFLFDVTRTFADLDLDVHVAKVATYGDRVVDAFYVRDVLGRKVEDPEAIGEIESAVKARLAD